MRTLTYDQAADRTGYTAGTLRKMKDLLVENDMAVVAESGRVSGLKPEAVPFLIRHRTAQYKKRQMGRINRRLTLIRQHGEKLLTDLNEIDPTGEHIDPTTLPKIKISFDKTRKKWKNLL